MISDRATQLQMLEKLYAVYPDSLNVHPLIKADPELNATLFYFFEHGLIDGTHISPLSGGNQFLNAKITMKGIDFIKDDGGLSAILGVVTIKLHEDTVRQLLLQRVSAADIPPEQKATLLEKIRSLPGKGFEKLTEKMLEKGADGLIAKAPDLLDILSQIIG